MKLKKLLVLYLILTLTFSFPVATWAMSDKEKLIKLQLSRVVEEFYNKASTDYFGTRIDNLFNNKAELSRIIEEAKKENLDVNKKIILYVFEPLVEKMKKIIGNDYSHLVSSIYRKDSLHKYSLPKKMTTKEGAGYAVGTVSAVGLAIFLPVETPILLAIFTIGGLGLLYKQIIDKEIQKENYRKELKNLVGNTEIYVKNAITNIVNGMNNASEVSSNSVFFTLTNEQFDNRWSNLRKGLTKEEVISMFGKPSYADDKYIDYNGHLIGFFKDKVYFWDY